MTGTGDQEQDMVAVIQHAAHENFRLIEDHDLDAVAANVTADFVNWRSADEPVAARTSGPAGMAATVAWLNRAFAAIRFEIHETIVSGARVAVRVTMHATQHGPFVVHDSPDGAVTAVFPSRGRTAAVDQTRWFTVVDGKVSEQDAVRDDLGMAQQLGWVPPNPAYLIAMKRSTMAERRARSRARRPD